MNVVEFLARTPLLMASLLLPGWLVLLACRLPRSLAAAFPLSMALIYLIVITVVLVADTLSPLVVGAALAAMCAALSVVPGPRDPPATTPASPISAMSRWLLAFLALSTALFAWRAFAQPLSGPDTPFRWNFLALEIVRTGEFSYYPPVTLADFERYFYADGFAPFVSLQYWWSYAVLGTTLPHVTGLVVTGQFVATLALVSDLVAHTAGRTAGHAAAAILASSSLVFWTYLLGQETSWIALALVAALWCWTMSPPSPRRTFVPLAAAVALLPALVAREYGPVLIAAGGLLALHAGARWRELLLFSLVAAGLAAPWYLHVWARCGNPFYSLSPLALFPTNDTLTGLLESYRERFAIPHQRPGLLAYRLADLVINSPFAIAAALLALLAWRQHGRLLIVAGLLVGLWFSAAAYTSGGLHIANRALTPVLVVLTLVAALHTSRIALSPRLLRPLTAFAAIAAIWSLYVNAAPPSGPVPPAPGSWWSSLTHRASITSTSPSSSVLPGSLPPGTRIASDNAYYHAAEHAAGFAHPIVPFWATELRFMFSPTLTATAAAAQLRALNIGAIHVQRIASPNWPHWSRAPFFGEIVATWPLVENPAGLELRRVPAASGLSVSTARP